MLKINNLDELFAIMEKFDKSAIDHMKLQTADGGSVLLKKNCPPAIQPPPFCPAPPNASPFMPLSAAPSAAPAAADKKTESTLPAVKAPLVGTFYAAPAPGAEAFVTVGSRVKKGDIVCIIEAMKVMNEIESEYSGTVTEICAVPGKPVEYGQPLFIIKPDSAV